MMCPPDTLISVPAQHRAGAPAGQMAEHRIAGLAGARRVVVKEQPNDIAGGKQALDRLIAGVDDARLGIDLDAAEAESDAARDRIGAERALDDRHRPVRFLWRDADGALAVELARHERDVGAAGGVEGFDRAQEWIGLNPDLLRELGERWRLDIRRRIVASVPEQVDAGLVVDLECDA